MRIGNRFLKFFSHTVKIRFILLNFNLFENFIENRSYFMTVAKFFCAPDFACFGKEPSEYVGICRVKNLNIASYLRKEKKNG